MERFLANTSQLLREVNEAQVTTDDCFFYAARRHGQLAAARAAAIASGSPFRWIRVSSLENRRNAYLQDGYRNLDVLNSGRDLLLQIFEENREILGDNYLDGLVPSRIRDLNEFLDQHGLQRRVEPPNQQPVPYVESETEQEPDSEPEDEQQHEPDDPETAGNLGGPRLPRPIIQLEPQPQPELQLEQEPEPQLDRQEQNVSGDLITQPIMQLEPQPQPGLELEHEPEQLLEPHEQNVVDVVGTEQEASQRDSQLELQPKGSRLNRKRQTEIHLERQAKRKSTVGLEKHIEPGPGTEAEGTKKQAELSPAKDVTPVKDDSST
ncbi:unnamed protein product [Caenorhabditis auriculariae]|uniref:Uncharacterized protein n=1 Tax=Caenorhabditis auriculariae TaxID=2777116 RepID=A0A8S1H6C1_9PELO|nr:unnamed protein product [Caenorhabditis auriculariae]